MSDIVNPSPSVVIGSPISGGTINEILYVNGSGNLAQSANLIWNDSTNTITFNGKMISPTTADFQIDAGGLRTLKLGTIGTGQFITIGASSSANGTAVQGNPLTLGNSSYATVMNGSSAGVTINAPVKINTSVIYSGAVDANLWLNNPSGAGVFRFEGQDYAKFEFAANHTATTNTGKWQWYVRNDGVNAPFMHLGLLNDAENSEQTGFSIFRSGNSPTIFELGGTTQQMDGSLSVLGGTGGQIFLAQSAGGTTDVRMTGDSQNNQYFAQFYFYDPEVGNGDNRVMGFQPRFDGSNPGDFTYTGAITKLDNVGTLHTPIVIGYDDAVSIGLALSDWNQADASLQVAGTFHVTSTSKLDGGINNYNSIATTGNGVPAIYAYNNYASLTGANTSVTSYTLDANDRSFFVSANVNIRTSTTHNFTTIVTYTDETNTARTLTLSFSNLAGTFLTAITNVTGVGPYEGVPVHIRCKASTTIIIKTTGTFTSVSYDVEGCITQIA